MLEGAHSMLAEVPESSGVRDIGLPSHPKTALLADNGKIKPSSFRTTQPARFESVQDPGQMLSETGGSAVSLFKFSFSARAHPVSTKKSKRVSFTLYIITPLVDNIRIYFCCPLERLIIVRKSCRVQAVYQADNSS